MGKGDKKSKKGKLFMGSFGNSRKKKSLKVSIGSAKPEAKAKAEAKK